MTGALLPVGVPAKPGMVIKAQVPCGGSIMRVKMTDAGPDGIYPHEKMEVFAMGFRNQSGVAFGPPGTKWANALAVTDNGANDLGHRRIANAPEKIFIVTEKGQDAGFPDKEGMAFVTNKRFAWQAYRGNPVDRPLPQLYIGDKPFVPKMPPYRFQFHVDGSRGVPLIAANPNPNGYINPVLEWDTNNPIDGIAWSASGFRCGQQSVRRRLWYSRYRPRESDSHLAGRAPRRIPRASRDKMVAVRSQYRARAECLPEAGKSRRPGAAQ